jgi:hypothetical protein
MNDVPSVSSFVPELASSYVVPLDAVVVGACVVNGAASVVVVAVVKDATIVSDVVGGQPHNEKINARNGALITFISKPRGKR